jgi:hypothetical protein
METLKKLNYLGPVCIAVDDTKIQPGLQAFQDSSGTWFAIGNVGTPICIKQPDDADPSAQEIADKLRSTNTLQAEKVRLYLLIIPLPHVSVQEYFYMMFMLVSGPTNTACCHCHGAQDCGCRPHVMV